jgi:hypothetical protein
MIARRLVAVIQAITLKNSILGACGSQNYKYILNPKTCGNDLYIALPKGNPASKILSMATLTNSLN